MSIYCCLVPRPHYSTRPKRFGSRGPSGLIITRWRECMRTAKIGPDLRLFRAVGRGKNPQKWDSSMAMVNKTSVWHFKVKNTPRKHSDGKENFKRMLSFLQVDKGRLFFIKLSFEECKINEFFITADRSTWPVLKRQQAAKFWKNFHVHFVLYSQENYVFVNILF